MDEAAEAGGYQPDFVMGEKERAEFLERVRANRALATERTEETEGLSLEIESWDSENDFMLNLEVVDTDYSGSLASAENAEMFILIKCSDGWSVMVGSDLPKVSLPRVRENLLLQFRWIEDLEFQDETLEGDGSANAPFQIDALIQKKQWIMNYGQPRYRHHYFAWDK